MTHENDAEFKFVSINKVLLVTQPCSFIYMVLRAVFTIQGQRWILVTEMVGYMGLKILIIWPFTENICWPLLYSLEGPSDPTPGFQCVPWQSEHYGKISFLLSRFSLILLFFFKWRERHIKGWSWELVILGIQYFFLTWCKVTEVLSFFFFYPFNFLFYFGE